MDQDTGAAPGEKKAKRTPEEKAARAQKKERKFAEMSPQDREAHDAKRAARKEAKKDQPSAE